MPCSDIHFAFNESDHTTTYHDEHESHDHNHDKDTQCSPFCTCTCCHTPMNFETGRQNLMTNPLLVNVSTDDNTLLYYDCPSSSYLNTIWQPPKINV